MDFVLLVLSLALAGTCAGIWLWLQAHGVAERLRRAVQRPVLIDDHGEIVAGHGRVAAAKQLGLAEVPTIVLGHLTAAERRQNLESLQYIAAAAAQRAGPRSMIIGAHDPRATLNRFPRRFVDFYYGQVLDQHVGEVVQLVHQLLQQTLKALPRALVRGGHGGADCRRRREGGRLCSFGHGRGRGAARQWQSC